ncbi:MAG: hypothetical protein HYU70_05205 [Bacteroidetes bacterium]|nr:hypothetical protein [Bacteroidota bacterium]
MIRGTLYFILLSILFLSCHKDTTPETPKGCGFINYRYYRGAKDTLGELSNKYIVVAFDTTYSETNIRKFISASKDFDQQYRYTLYSSKVAALRFNTPKTCEEITAIIFNLEKNAIVEFAHYAMKTNNCQSMVMQPLGNLCVDSYSNYFYVKVINENKLSDLYRLITETNTELVYQDTYMKQWFVLKANKRSKGDALHMANYFYETKLFVDTDPELNFKFPVE